jgi:hypothetical protein
LSLIIVTDDAISGIIIIAGYYILANTHIPEIKIGIDNASDMTSGVWLEMLHDTLAYMGVIPVYK